MTVESKPIVEVLRDLENAPVRDLVPWYAALFGKQPRCKNRRWLQDRIAWEEQARRFGGLSVAAKRRIAELQRELQLPCARTPVVPGAAKRPSSGEPPLGTRLEREWRGRTIVAVRVERGWEVDGAVHRSLSAVAKAATGSHRSGPAFFGLVKGRSA